MTNHSIYSIRLAYALAALDAGEGVWTRGEVEAARAEVPHLRELLGLSGKENDEHKTGS